jgi:hypothetical protein
MNTYQFELVFRIGEGKNPMDYQDALFEAGCDDATMGVGRIGYLGAMFDREANNAIDAIESAINDIRKAIPESLVEKVEPFMMNTIDIGIRYGLSKASVSKYVLGKDNKRGNKEPFPEQIHSAWYAVDVSKWFKKNTTVKIDNSEIEMVGVVHLLNLAIAKTKAQPVEIDGLLKSFAA